MSPGMTTFEKCTSNHGQRRVLQLPKFKSQGMTTFEKFTSNHGQRRVLQLPLFYKPRNDQLKK